MSVESPAQKGTFSTHVEAETVLRIGLLSFFAILSETSDKTKAMVPESLWLTFFK